MIEYDHPLFWMVFIFIISNITLFQAAHNWRGGNCNDFTIDKCRIDPGSLLETVKDISDVNCQFYCNVIYEGRCTFFIYDRREVLCELVNEPFENYINTCGKFGGPSNPSMSECSDSDDKCKVIMNNVKVIKHTLLNIISFNQIFIV